MRYLVSYTVDRYFQGDTSAGEDGLLYRPEGHTLIVQADTKVQAFIAAYENLTAQGHLVCTTGPLYGSRLVWAGGSEEGSLEMAGLSSDEMRQVYKSGIPAVGHEIYGPVVAMVNIKSIEPYRSKSVEMVTEAVADSSRTSACYVDLQRINQLRTISSKDFDLTKLVRLCEELNECRARNCFLAIAMLARAILDHVPPVFGCNTFEEVANNYGGRSFKKSMQRLQNSLRSIADSHLHLPIRRREELPTWVQVNFSNDLDVLLEEIVRMLK